MKSKISLVVIGFILGVILTSGIATVFALTYKASDITYSPTDNTWNVSTVGEAINDLALSKTSDNYSTNEQVVGTWIDGKPIYQKTITGLSFSLQWNNQYNAHYNIDTPIANVDTLISAFAITSYKAPLPLAVDIESYSNKWELMSVTSGETLNGGNISTLTFKYTKIETNN